MVLFLPRPILRIGIIGTRRISYLEPLKKRETEQGENPLRNADNRIPLNFHGLLVNQKASYMFTAPPLFDLGNKASNKALTAFLGDKYAKTCKDLCVEASNASVAWLHLWKDKASGQYNVCRSCHRVR